MSQWSGESSEKKDSQISLSTSGPLKMQINNCSQVIAQIRNSSKIFVIHIITKNLAFNVSGALFFVGLASSLKWWYKDQLFVALLKQNLPAVSEPQQKISWETGEYMLQRQDFALQHLPTFTPKGHSVQPLRGLLKSNERTAFRPVAVAEKRFTSSGKRPEILFAATEETSVREKPASRLYETDNINLYANHLTIQFKPPWQKHAYERFVGLFSEPIPAKKCFLTSKHTKGLLPSRAYFEDQSFQATSLAGKGIAQRSNPEVCISISNSVANKTNNDLHTYSQPEEANRTGIAKRGDSQLATIPLHQGCIAGTQPLPGNTNGKHVMHHLQSDASSSCGADPLHPLDVQQTSEACEVANTSTKQDDASCKGFDNMEPYHTTSLKVREKKYTSTTFGILDASPSFSKTWFKLPARSCYFLSDELPFPFLQSAVNASFLADGNREFLTGFKRPLLSSLPKNPKTSASLMHNHNLTELEQGTCFQLGLAQATERNISKIKNKDSRNGKDLYSIVFGARFIELHTILQSCTFLPLPPDFLNFFAISKDTPPYSTPGKSFLVKWNHKNATQQLENKTSAELQRSSKKALPLPSCENDSTYANDRLATTSKVGIETTKRWKKGSLSKIVGKLSYPLELTSVLTGWQPPSDSLLLNSYLDEIPFKLESVFAPVFLDCSGAYNPGFASNASSSCKACASKMQTLDVQQSMEADKPKTLVLKEIPVARQSNNSITNITKTDSKHDVQHLMNRFSLVFPPSDQAFTNLDIFDGASQIQKPLHLMHSETVQTLAPSAFSSCEACKADLKDVQQRTLRSGVHDACFASPVGVQCIVDSPSPFTLQIDAKNTRRIESFFMQTGRQKFLNIAKPEEWPLKDIYKIRKSETFLKKLHLFQVKQLLKNELQFLINGLPCSFVNKSTSKKDNDIRTSAAAMHSANVYSSHNLELKDCICVIPKEIAFETSRASKMQNLPDFAISTTIDKFKSSSNLQNRKEKLLQTVDPNLKQKIEPTQHIKDAIIAVQQKHRCCTPKASSSLDPFAVLPEVCKEAHSMQCISDTNRGGSEEDALSRHYAETTKESKLDLSTQRDPTPDINGRHLEPPLAFHMPARSLEQQAVHSPVDASERKKATKSLKSREDEHLYNNKLPKISADLSKDKSLNSLFLLNNLGFTFNNLSSLDSPPVLLPINNDASFWMWKPTKKEQKQKTTALPSLSNLFRISKSLQILHNPHAKGLKLKGKTRVTAAISKVSRKTEGHSTSYASSEHSLDCTNKTLFYFNPESFTWEIFQQPALFWDKPSTPSCDASQEKFRLMWQYFQRNRVNNCTNKMFLGQKKTSIANVDFLNVVDKGVNFGNNRSRLMSGYVYPDTDNQSIRAHLYQWLDKKRTRVQGLNLPASIIIEGACLSHIEIPITPTTFTFFQRDQSLSEVFSNNSNNKERKFDQKSATQVQQKWEHFSKACGVARPVVNQSSSSTCAPYSCQQSFPMLAESLHVQSREVSPFYEKLHHRLALFPGFSKPSEFVTTLPQLVKGDQNVTNDFLSFAAKDRKRLREEERNKAIKRLPTNLKGVEQLGLDRFLIDCNARKTAYHGVAVQRNNLTKDLQPALPEQSFIWGLVYLGAENPLTDRQCHFFGQKQLSTLDTSIFQRDYLRQLGKETIAQSNKKGFTEKSPVFERAKFLSFSKTANSFLFRKRRYTYLLDKNDQWFLLFQEQLRTALDDARKNPSLTQEETKTNISSGTQAPVLGRIKISAPLIMARFPKKGAQTSLLSFHTAGCTYPRYEQSVKTRVNNASSAQYAKQTSDGQYTISPRKQALGLLENTSSSCFAPQLLGHLGSCLQSNSPLFLNSPLQWFLQEPLHANSWAVINQWLFLVAVLLWIEQMLLENVFPALSTLEQILLGSTGIRLGNRTNVVRVTNTSTSKNPKFQNLAGIDGLLGELSELVLFLRGHRERFLNKKSSYGVLLTGPPGTGKTFLVRALANEARVPVLILSAGTLVANKVNSSKPSWSIRHAFRRAKQLAPCILFIDEIDALGKSRGKIVTDINEIVADTNLSPSDLHQNQATLNSATFGRQNSLFTQTSATFRDRQDPYWSCEAGWPSVSKLLLNKWEHPLKSIILQEGNEINRCSLCDEEISNIMGLESSFSPTHLQGDRSGKEKIGNPATSTTKYPTGGERADSQERTQHFNKSQDLTTLHQIEENSKRKFGPLTQLLVSMDGISNLSGVLIMGATNRPELLDSALTRPGRFERIIRVERPSEQKRIEILKLYSNNLGVQHKIPWHYLANRTKGLTAADLAVAMNYSSLRAIIQGSMHTLETIEYGLNSITR